MNAVDVRLALLQAGYVPIPAKGKAPHLNGWQTKTATNAAEIAVQARQFADHTNTGILTKSTPAVDIDITFLPAAEAVEALAREVFEERGAFLLRIGKAPKRAFLLRTDEPFDKLTAAFTAPDESTHKIEILGAGQQVIVDGIHPGTGKPYAWHGGTPLSVPRDDLPYTRREDMVDFLAKASKLLVEEFGFQPVGGKAKANGADHDGGQYERADWAELIGKIIAGRDLHDSATRLAASYLASGMDTTNATRAIEALFLTSDIPRDERWKARFNDIGRAVRDADRKYGKDDGGGDGTPEATGEAWKWRYFGEHVETVERKYLIDKLLPETGVGLISGQWGTYKTFVALDLVAAIITDTPFAGFETARTGAALFVALEGEGEVDIRLRAALAHRGRAGQELEPFAWINACPRLLDPDAGKSLTAMVKQAAEKIRQDFNLPVVLVIVDTAGKAAGYAKPGDENDAVVGKQIITAMAEASRATGALFMGVDHFGKAVETGTRGSSAKESDCDAVLALLGDKSISGEVTKARLAIRKRRSGANGIEISFRTRVVQAGDNETTLVIDWEGQAETSAAERGEKKDKWAKSLRVLKFALMSTLAEHGQDCRPIEGGPTVRAVDQEIIRGEFYKTYPAEGDAKAKNEARRKAFKRALADAQASRLIGVRDFGATTFMWLWVEPPTPHPDGPRYSAADEKQ